MWMREKELAEKTDMDGEVKMRCTLGSNQGKGGKKKKGCERRVLLCHPVAFELSLDLETAGGEV